MTLPAGLESLHEPAEASEPWQAALIEARLLAIPGVQRVALPQASHGGIVLFYPRTDTSWAEMVPLIDLIRRETDLLPLMLLSTEQGLQREADCREQSLGYVATTPIRNQDSGHFPRLAAGWRRLLEKRPGLAILNHLAQHDRVRHSLPVSLFRRRAVRRSLARDYALFRAILEILDPFFLALPGDRELGPGPALMRAALDLELPSMVAVPAVPSIDADSKKRSGQIRFGCALRQMPLLLNLLVAWRLPEQVAHTPYGKMLFSPGWLLDVLERAGMWSSNPWCSGAGNCSSFLASGPWQEAVFLEHGCPGEKIKTLGLIHHDAIFEAWSERQSRREELERQHALEPERPLIVVAVPSFAEQDLVDWPRHRRELDRHFAVLKNSGANVVLSLHPKARAADYQELADRYAFPIEERRLFEFLPTADLFVAGGSATIDWAILCGIPVFNVDYAHLDTDIWSDFEAVVETKTADDFAALMERFGADEAFRQSLYEKQAHDGRRFAQFDGRAGARWLEFVLDLRDRKREQRAALSA